MMSSPIPPIALKSGCFNQHPTISKAEVDRLASDQLKPSQINALWDHIKDWFFGTHLCEAKECLYNMIHSPDSNQKVEHFFRLRDLCAPPFRENLKMDIVNHGKVDLSIGSGWKEPMLSVYAGQSPQRFGEYNRLCLDQHLPSLLHRSDEPEIRQAIFSKVPNMPENSHTFNAWLVDKENVTHGVRAYNYEVKSIAGSEHSALLGVMKHNVTVYKGKNGHLFLGNARPSVFNS